jgi:hypothetical protein
MGRSGAAAAAAATGADSLRSEIEDYFKRFGSVHWDGADKFDVREDGDAAVAVIVNGRFSVRKNPSDPISAATIALDRMEIRRQPAASGDGKVEFVVTLPSKTTLTALDGTELTLSLTDATATAVVDEPGNRYRSIAASFAAARIERTGTADWIKFGAMTMQSKLAATDGGGWSGPIASEVKAIEFLFAEPALAGTIERIGYTADASGPNLAALDALRDEASALRDKMQDDPGVPTDQVLALLPKFFGVFTQSKGELAVEGTTIKRPGGDTLVSLAKATLAGSLTGVGGDSAALRFTLGHDGLAVAPSVVAEPQVPRRLVVDFGIEDIAGAPLRTVLEAAGKTGPDASEADKQAALPQILGAAMALKPTLRIYGITLEFKDVRIDASGEAQRAPPAPIGYTASGDITVHGFDALAGILTDKNDRMQLPLVKFLGVPETDGDGGAAIKFHLTSELGKPLFVNGQDISGWRAGASQTGRMPAGPPRVLRLADPPEEGSDVRAVQKAVEASEVEPFADGVYDTATALAVARYQKQAGINVSGVVDAATRDRLGLNPPPPPSPSPKN